MSQRIRPTISDLAERLGISAASVSNALRGTGRISPERTREVRLLAERLGYVPDHAGRALRTGRSGTIGLVISDMANPLFPGFAQAIARAAMRRGYAVMLADALDDPAGQDAVIATLIARGVDALAIIPRRGTEVGALPVPVAIIDSAAMPGNTVSSDHRDGGRQAARHLADLGHQNILILGGPDNSTVAGERVGGMREVFGARPGIEVTIIHSLASLEQGARAVETLDPSGVTAIAAAYDTLAIGALTALQRRGIAVPGAVSITGFDDLVWGHIVQPQLTSIRQDLDAVAEIAIAKLDGQVSDGKLVPVELIIRQSTAPPPAAAR